MFAMCSDHCIRLIDGSDLMPPPQNQQGSFTHTDIRVRTVIQLPVQFFSNCAFNQQYTNLAVSSRRGVFILNNPPLFESNQQQFISSESDDAKNFAKPAIDFDQGQTVALANLNPYGHNFLVLKESGCLQIWSLKSNEILNRLHLDAECSTMCSHAKMPLAVVGTATGRLIFVDLSDEKEPRLIEDVRVHKGRVKILKFNTSGTLLFSVGEDSKMFVIDTRLSGKVEKMVVKADQRLVTNNAPTARFEKGFYVLGYTEFEGEVVCVDTLDTLISGGKL